MLNISLVGHKEAVEKLKRVTPGVMNSLKKVVTKLVIALQRLVKEKLSGPVLNVRTDALRSGIFYEVDSSANGVHGRVASSRDVPYAAIHEFGGTIKHPGGTAYIIDSKTKMAEFISNKSAIAAFLPRTAPHDIKMPERSFMRSSLKDMRKDIVDEIQAAVKEGARNA